MLAVVVAASVTGVSGVTGTTTDGRSWLFESCDDEVVMKVLGSFPVKELSPRKAVSTKIRVSAIFDDLPASSAAFL